MIKTLLAEQFQLKVHEEIKDGPVIELVRGFKMEYADSLSDIQGPAMLTAIQGLGLSLRSARGPTRYIVIDQVVPLGK